MAAELSEQDKFVASQRLNIETNALVRRSFVVFAGRRVSSMSICPKYCHPQLPFGHHFMSFLLLFYSVSRLVVWVQLDAAGQCDQSE